MAFVMPAGDYERALRLSKGSNFIEALESGIDRNLRRRGQREALRQQRDLYERGLGLEKERLAEKHLSGIEGYDRDFPAVATAGANEAALADFVTAASTQAAVDGALAEGAAVAQGVPVVQATPAQVEQAVVASTPIQGVELGPEEPPGPVYGPVAPPADKPWWWGGRTYEEAFPIQDRPSVADLGPGRVVDLKSLPPEEFALATPRSQQLLTDQQKTAIEIATKLADMGRAEEAQSVLDYAGVNAKAYDDLPTVTPPLQPAPQARMTPEEQGMVSRYLRGVTEDTDTQRDPLIGEGTLGTAVQQLMDQGRYVDAQTIEDASGGGGRVYPDVDTEYFADAPVALDLPPEGDAVSDAARAAGAIGASLPGGGGTSSIQAALSAMAGSPSRIEGGVPTFPAAEPSPLEAAIATGAEASERAELVGPEVEVSTAPVEVVDEKTGKVHTVKPGEFVYGIAKSYGASPQALIKANQSLFIGEDGKARSLKTKGGKTLAGADLIFPVEKLRIPTGEGRETGGPAGPVDTREGAKEGVLAKAEKGAKSEKEVLVRLEKEQAKRTDVPLNPFQAFGRDIGYTPSIGAVAYATHMAEQGDFSMINMMAGRVVKNAEIPGLFARYSNFASGARRRSKEILLEEKLVKETKAQALKQRGANAYMALAFKEITRSGVTGEDAQVVAGHFGDLYSSGDTVAANMFLKNIVSTSADKIKAVAAVEAARVKFARKNYGGGRTGVVAPDGRGTAKAISAAEKRLDRLAKTRGDALRPLMKARGLSEGMSLSDDDLASLAKDPAYAAALTAYNQANERYTSQENQLGILINGRPENPSPFVMLTSSKKIADLADKYGETGDWDGFTREISLYGEVTPEIAEQVVEFFSGKAPPAVTPSKVTSSPKARSSQDVSAEIDLVSARRPSSAAEESRVKRELARLGKEQSSVGRQEVRDERNRELLSRFNKVTNEAEDLMNEVEPEDRAANAAAQKVVADLRGLLSELSDNRELQAAHELGTAARGLSDPSELRRGVSISTDIRNLRFFISQLGG